MKIGFYTLGCKLNQTETEAIVESFSSEGYETVSVHEEADLYIINTCTVTSKSEQKARRIIRYLLNHYPQARVWVTGCYAQLDPDLLMGVDKRVEVIPGSLKSNLIALFESLPNKKLLNKEDLPSPREFLTDTCNNPFRLQPVRFRLHSRAFLKIQDGCNYHCAYCRVRLARGPSVSLPFPQLIERFQGILEQGYEEIVLTGVNISLYHWEGKNFGDVLLSLLKLPGRFRIRLSSLEPEAFTPSLLEALSLPQICPHIHLSLQSASDAVLRRMRRPYTQKQVQHLLDSLCKVHTNLYLAADIITGFPSETDADHQITREFLSTNPFLDVHVFPFSPRPGTEGYKMKPRIPERIARQRAKEITSVVLPKYRNYLQCQVGRTLTVLVEEVTKEGEWAGTAENYVTVRGSRLSEEANSYLRLKKGKLYPCVIVNNKDNYLIGNII
ncbi:MAG: tRNA (N(6)-L-threonylcarbamoyladenosine(37)-C(2))-methylthiotransferase MtaB [Spirochaetales bacterium]